MASDEGGELFSLFLEKEGKFFVAESSELFADSCSFLCG